MGNYVLFGRRTYESLPKALEGRELIVLTRSGKTNLVHGGEIVFDLGQVIVGYARRASEIYVGGGADVYRLTLPMASTLDLTVVHTEAADADTFFPPVDLSVWGLKTREDRPADEHNPPLTYLSLVRKQPDVVPNAALSGPLGCWKTALDVLRDPEF